MDRRACRASSCAFIFQNSTSGLVREFLCAIVIPLFCLCGSRVLRRKARIALSSVHSAENESKSFAFAIWKHRSLWKHVFRYSTSFGNRIRFSEIAKTTRCVSARRVSASYLFVCNNKNKQERSTNSFADRNAKYGQMIHSTVRLRCDRIGINVPPECSVTKRGTSFLSRPNDKLFSFREKDGEYGALCTGSNIRIHRSCISDTRSVNQIARRMLRVAPVRCTRTHGRRVCDGGATLSRTFNHHVMVTTCTYSSLLLLPPPELFDWNCGETARKKSGKRE